METSKSKIDEGYFVGLRRSCATPVHRPIRRHPVSVLRTLFCFRPSPFHVTMTTVEVARVRAQPVADEAKCGCGLAAFAAVEAVEPNGLGPSFAVVPTLEDS
jgi:hypothetical protein